MKKMFPLEMGIIFINKAPLTEHNFQKKWDIQQLMAQNAATSHKEQNHY